MAAMEVVEEKKGEEVDRFPASQVGRVAELGSFSSGTKKALKIFVKRVFTIFTTNASFLRVISNFRI